MAAQFVRVEAFSVKESQRILGEASRDAAFCSHVSNPEAPRWWIGSPETIADAIKSHMSIPVPYRSKSGKLFSRQPRSDHRALLGGVLSWPVPMDQISLPQNKSLAKQLFLWMRASIEWLKEKFGKHLQGVCSHADETYPHLHMLAVGDANLLHPGLQAEFEGGKRLSNRKEKKRRYRAAMRLFLDDYFQKVGSKFGLERSTGKRPLSRIKDRAVANRVLDLEKKLADVEDVEAGDMLDKIVEDAPKRPRQGMVF